MKNIFVAKNTIEFIDSDHNKSNQQDSQFIQLIDLLLGATLVNLHSESRRNNNKAEIGMVFQPHLKRILDRNINVDRNSGEYYKREFPYYRKCNISFFPIAKLDTNEFIQKTLSGDLAENFKDSFYYQRPIILTNPDEGNLFNFLK
jgi:hypothetical protein